MKQFIFFLLLFFSCYRSEANPILEPPIISEIYFGNESFQIELFFQEFYEGAFTNLDNLNLACSGGIVEFNDGIVVVINEAIVLDESDFKSTFYFNPAGDMIWIEEDMGWMVGGDSFVFGDYPYSVILAPNADQSLATQGYFDSQMGYMYIQDRAIEQPPTLGNNEFNINANGTLEGYVFDLNNNPIPWLNVYNATTDPSGYFQIPDMLCRVYANLWIKHDGNLIHFFSDTIYPYETSFVEIHLDTLLVGIPEYVNHPNPFTELTSFSIQIPDEMNFSKGLLKIFDVSGKIVGRIEIPDHTASLNWNSQDQHPGIYFYHIVLDNQTFATKKMIKL